MGCMPSKNIDSKVSPASARRTSAVQQNLSNEDKASFFKARLIDSIKRQDLVLFEKSLQQYQFKPTETFGPSEHKKNILHYLAEFNFAEGMELIIEFINQNFQNQLQTLIEAKDSKGNTPAVTCYLHDAVETLEILAKNGEVEQNGKNNDLKHSSKGSASENETGNFLSVNNSQVTRSPTTTRSISTSAYLGQPTPKVQLLKKCTLKDKEDETALSSSRLSVQLKSVQSVSNNDKLNPSTRLFSVLNDLASKNTNFDDSEFPHDIFSLLGEEPTDSQMDDFKDIKWLRPQEFHKSDSKTPWKIFEGIDLNTVADGPLVGCNLYSALAALNEFPQKLLKLFTSKEANKHGAYSVNFLIAGVSVEILLDDYFPCKKNGEPIFSLPSSNELWFLLIEKAFAKLYGSYKDVREVQLCDAFELLTGMPTSQHQVKEIGEDELWNMMLEFDKRNYIFCAGNNEKEGNQKKNRAFTIARLYETDQHKIVKLRNHFMDYEWEGDFSTNSSLWTRELKEQVGHYSGEKNYFYMDIKDLIKNFDSLSVCHYHENWVRNSLDAKCKPNKAVFFEVEVEREMEVFISVHQKLAKFLEEDAPDYDLSPVEILVAEVLDDGVLKRIAAGEKNAFTGKQTVFADDKIKLKLSEGKYIIRVKVRWIDNEKHGFTLNTYSPSPLTLVQGKSKRYAGFLEKIYLNAGAASADRYQLGNRCEFASSWCGPHLWFYGINRGTKTWTLEITLNKIENLKVCKKYRTEENVVRLVIPPKEQKVAYAKRINMKGVELNWNFTQSWQ